MLEKLLTILRSAKNGSSFLVDPPSARATRVLLTLARLIAFVQVGRIRIKGLEILESLQAPYIVTSNHPHYVDAAIIPIMINAPARYMVASGVMRFAFGLGGLIIGPGGCFAVDVDEGRGAPAYRAAVKVLTSNQRLVMFPEGWAHLDGKMREFKKGTVCIAKASAKKLNHAVNIVPIFLHYGRYPGVWINRLNPPLQYLLTFLGFLRYRRGVTVVVGNPISSSVLPKCNNTATEMLRNAIIDLDPAKN